MMNDHIKNFILLTIFLASATSCRRTEDETTFADVCHNENQAMISIRGFLKTAPENSVDHSGRLLLVENENGTGGFIQIKTKNSDVFSNNSQVMITGEILKDENSCVLKFEKIETP